MKNLIEELISKSEIDTFEELSTFTEKYNIITAPKQIKLSEVVENLEGIKEYYHISSIVYDKEFRGLLDSEDYYPPIVEFNKDLSFKVINLPINDNTKWLYALWIAGTEIIDDMEEK